MNRYKLFMFLIVFWWSLVCPPSLGFPDDVFYPAGRDASIQSSTGKSGDEKYADIRLNNVKVKFRFKYLTFLNKYVD